MSGNLAVVLAGGIPGALALVGVIFVRFDTKRAERDQAKERTKSARTKVDQEAYDRARRTDLETIDQLRTELDRARTERIRDREEMQDELDKLERQLMVLRRDLSGEQQENLRLRGHIDRLEATVANLRAKLVTAGMFDERQQPQPPPPKG